MKTQFLKSFILAAIVATAISSCKKDDAAAPALTNDEAASAVGDMLASDFTGTTSDAATVSNQDASNAGGREMQGGRTLASSCGVTMDSVVSRTSASGATITYMRTATFSYTLTCNGVIPSSVAMTFTGSSTRTGIKISADGASNGAFALTGFEVAKSEYTLNGSFNRTETVTEIAGAKTYTGNHALTITDVLIDKTTKELKGGSATYTMTGVTGAGATYSHSGTITFLGGGSATIVVNGSTYTVNLVTGTVTAS